MRFPMRPLYEIFYHHNEHISATTRSSFMRFDKFTIMRFDELTTIRFGVELSLSQS